MVIYTNKHFLQFNVVKMKVNIRGGDNKTFKYQYNHDTYYVTSENKN